MRNWLLPVVVLGMSGLGLVFASERGREQVRQLFDRLASSEDPLGEFNNAVENQLETIQRALDRLSEALEASQ
jgi:hypothetical protein